MASSGKVGMTSLLWKSTERGSGPHLPSHLTCPSFLSGRLDSAFASPATLCLRYLQHGFLPGSLISLQRLPFWLAPQEAMLGRKGLFQLVAQGMQFFKAGEACWQVAGRMASSGSRKTHAGAQLTVSLSPSRLCQSEPQPWNGAAHSGRVFLP